MLANRLAWAMAAAVILCARAAEAAEKGAPPKTAPEKSSAPDKGAADKGTTGATGGPDKSASEKSTLAPKASEADEPAPETAEGGSPGETSVRGLSWDLKGGGIPSSGGLIEGSLGFSGLPRVAYHHTLAPELSIGGMVSMDYGYWSPDRAFSSSLLFQAPIRYSLNHSSSLSAGIRLDPGLGFLFASQHSGPFFLGLLLNASASFGYTVQNRFIVGGGVDLPMAILIPTGGGTWNLTFPILVGPIFEFHVTPPLALTADLKIGPHINSSGGTVFGLVMMGGIAYRL